MTDLAPSTAPTYQSRLKQRYRSERIFRALGAGALLVAGLFLAIFLTTIIRQAIPAFTHHYLTLEIALPKADIDPAGTRDPKVIGEANVDALVRNALQTHFPEVTSRTDRRALSNIISSGAGAALRREMLARPDLIGGSVKLSFPIDDNADLHLKGLLKAGGSAKFGEKEIAYTEAAQAKGLIEKRLSREFFLGGASREAEQAGILVAVIGSFLTLIVALGVSFPLGVATAIYLEEFAPRNRFTSFIELNINNLAAVPSIIYGLLGLAIFLNLFNMPRSAPIVGGLVLALMTLPIIIIASRAAIRAVPPSIREAALGLGASHQQAVFHHVLPLAMPGILTGTILGMAHALGETAPLLMIGMVAFVVDAPKGFLDSATLLPVQIFMWADFPEAAFQHKTAAAIIVLLVFLVVMNSAAVLLRKAFERRW